MFPVEAKILVVEDSPFSRKTIKDCLRQLKYSRVLEAQDGEDAQRVLSAKEQMIEPVHLLISDLNMPKMNGIELLRWVRTQPQYQGLPVIFLSAEQEKNSILEAVNLGISHYVIKPFDLATLTERIESTWRKHGMKYYSDRNLKM